MSILNQIAGAGRVNFDPFGSFQRGRDDRRIRDLQNNRDERAERQLSLNEMLTGMRVQSFQDERQAAATAAQQEAALREAQARTLSGELTLNDLAAMGPGGLERAQSIRTFRDPTPAEREAARFERDDRIRAEDQQIAAQKRAEDVAFRNRQQGSVEADRAEDNARADQQLLVQQQQAETRAAERKDRKTESQSRADRFHTRMTQANTVLDQIDETGFKMLGRAASFVTGGIGATDARKRYEAALEAWISGVARADSGAAIPPAEMRNFKRIYGVRPGDSDQVIREKQALRRAETESMARAARIEVMMKDSENADTSTDTNEDNDPPPPDGFKVD